jgi:transmembrane sensor
MSTANELETQAAAWLVRRDAGPLAHVDQTEFELWLGADPRHRATYVRLEQAWRRADRLGWLKPHDGPVDEDLLASSPFKRIDDAPVQIDEVPASASTRASAPDDAPVADTAPIEAPARRRPRFAVPALIAASLAAIALSVGFWVQHSRNPWQRFATDLGGFERVVLDDTSIVHLNTDSAIRVLLTPDHRYVVLERGEALFKVAHDASRPFDVQAAGITVRAVGTEFSVRVRDAQGAMSGQQNVEVLVREGRVAINPPAAPALPAAAAAPTRNTSMLSAGESITVTAKRIELAKVAEPDVARKLSWVEGRLWFERQRLDDVVTEFNRYNRRQLVIADPAIADLRIGGGFEATDTDSFTAALERTLPVRVDRTDPNFVRLYGRDSDSQDAAAR